MVVESDHDLADSMCVWIGVCTGWTAIAAYGAEEAVVKARDEPFDAVLLDIGMAGTDGFDTASRLDGANEASHPAILALTGDAELRDAASVDRRFVASLLKPADSGRLLGLLADLEGRN